MTHDRTDVHHRVIQVNCPRCNHQRGTEITTNIFCHNCGEVFSVEKQKMTNRNPEIETSLSGDVGWCASIDGLQTIEGCDSEETARYEAEKHVAYENGKLDGFNSAITLLQSYSPSVREMESSDE